MLQSQPNIQMQAIFDLIYPIGSLYFSTSLNTVDKVQEKFGGTWERLPEGYAIWTASSGAGSTIDAGLPNLQGMVTNICINGGSSFNGPFTTSNTSQVTVGALASRSLQVATLRFDANRSLPSIYKNNVTTVQPPAYKVYVYRRTALSGGGA